MNRAIVVLSLLTAALGAAAPAEELPQNAVRLQPARWRATRQILQKSAEQAGFRWAVPATITRRAFVGTNEDKTSTAAAVVQDLCRQTGLTAEVRSGVIVVHKPDAARLKALAAQLESKDERARLVAAWELGWLRDANAWPILAKAAVGTDTALALAAAQALRRIDTQGPTRSRRRRHIPQGIRASLAGSSETRCRVRGRRPCPRPRVPPAKSETRR